MFSDEILQSYRSQMKEKNETALKYQTTKRTDEIET